MAKDKGASLKILDIEVDLVFAWAFRLFTPVRLINDDIPKREPIQAYGARVWLCPLSLMLLVDLAVIAFADLNVGERNEIVGAITLANLLQIA